MRKRKLLSARYGWYPNAKLVNPPKNVKTNCGGLTRVHCIPSDQNDATYFGDSQLAHQSYSQFQPENVWLGVKVWCIRFVCAPPFYISQNVHAFICMKFKSSSIGLMQLQYDMISYLIWNNHHPSVHSDNNWLNTPTDINIPMSCKEMRKRANSEL